MVNMLWLKLYIKYSKEKCIVEKSVVRVEKVLILTGAKGIKASTMNSININLC